MGAKPHPIFHINEFPGIRKLTIPKELQCMIGAACCRLMHNHLLIRLADAVLLILSAVVDDLPLRRPPVTM